MRRRTERPNASDISVTLHRFGRNRRLVLRFEWLTLWPTRAVLPVNSHRRDMAKTSDLRGRCWRARDKGQCFRERGGGRIVVTRLGVKPMAAASRLTHHTKDLFAHETRLEPR